MLQDLSIKDAIEELRELRDFGAANDLVSLVASDATTDSLETVVRDSSLLRPWKYTSVATAHVEPGTSKPVPADTVESDRSMMGKTFNLKIDSIYAADFPGFGEHEISVRWGAKHHIKNEAATDPVVFNQNFLVRDGMANSFVGAAAFLDLLAPPTGVGFELVVTYLKNKTAERFLKFFKADSVQSGLKMIQSINPAVGQVTNLATGVMESVLDRNWGREFYKAQVGMDFQDGGSGVRLRPGSYIIAQTPTPSLDWGEWKLVSNTVRKADGSEDHGESLLFPYNYFLVRVEVSSDLLT